MIIQEDYTRFVNELKIKLKNNNKKIVFVCIGTNKITGDSLGALIGSNLNKLLINNKEIDIIGNFEKPIHALNIEENMKYINSKYKDKFVIVIDSAISRKDLVGKIFVTKSKMKLNKGKNEEKLELGDISIKYSICEDLKDRNKNLQSLKQVPIQLIVDLSNIISLGIYEAISQN